MSGRQLRFCSTICSRSRPVLVIILKSLVLAFLAIALAVLGTICLLFPERLQQMDARDAETGLRAQFPSVKRYVLSSEYLVTTRIGGVICYIIAVVCVIGIVHPGHLPVK